MRRRELITILGLALVGGTATLWRNLASFWQPRFNNHTADTVKVITELMFPGDGLPGAAKLKIHDRIVAMSELHEFMAEGVGWLDYWAKANGAADFLALGEDARTAALEAAFASEGAKQFVLTLRYYVGLNYYSEPMIKAAFPYTGPPQPEGFADFHDPPQ
jgi:Gluconate 2-dehydrogenase subunit 3